MAHTPKPTSAAIATVLDRYDLVCGLEIHAELKTKSKMFCGCVNDPFHAPAPNMYTCPVCLGMPGGLPVPNKTAIEWTVKLGLALGAKINTFSKFDRKHYFYPDLAKGYQISQYDIPFCEGGAVELPEGTVTLTRIHLEEDTGKLQHTTVNGKKVSLLDFNRSGVPLAEIVSEPDIKSPAHAAAYGRELRRLMRYLEIADCDMEQGGMRLEANISLKPKGQKELPNYKVEVKNINSFRFLEQAIEYEIVRQSELLDSGETPSQETRGFRPGSGETFSQRKKESAADYRYFPDPDIPPIRFSETEIQTLKNSLPTPSEKVMKHWSSTFNIPQQYISLASGTASKVNFYEKIWEADAVGAALLASAIFNKKIEVDEQHDTAATVWEKFSQLASVDAVSDVEISEAIASVLSAQTEAVSKYTAGEQKVLGFLLGQTVKHIGKRIDPRVLRTALLAALATK